MAFQPVPKGIQANLVYRDQTTGRRIGENVLNFEFLGVGDVALANLTALTDILAPWWAFAMEPLCANTAQLGEIELKSLETEEAPYLVTPYNYQGNIINQILPLNVTIAISHTTGLTGRSARGRTFLCGLTESQVDGSYLTSTQAGFFVDAFDGLRGDLAGSDFTFVVLSRYTGGALRSAGVMRPVVASAFTDLKIDTQRRRIVQL